MEQSTQPATIDERLDRLETLVSSLRDDLACVIERTREDFEDLNTELDNRFQRVYESAERDYARRNDSLRQLKDRVDTDVDRIRYDIGCLESRCNMLECGGH